MKVLGIETSCDETAAGVVEDGRVILSDVVQTQFDLHGQYGGVVPELASRRHIEVILPVAEAALTQAGLTLSDLDGLAVTQGPGLVGALLVGLNFAKALALVTGLPLAGVNHVYGHVMAASLDKNPPDFPLAALVVSGGHTNLYLVRGPLDFELFGRTRDDAAGEAFDKVAKLMGLGYPGGVVIDKLADDGDPERFDLPRPMLGQGLDFSFSGLKTAVVNLVARRFGDRKIGLRDLADLAASFQAAVVDVLTRKTEVFLKKTKVKSLVLAGGVAANQGLRREAVRTAERSGVRLILPPPRLCTDNGAMIAALGFHHLSNGVRLDPDADAYSRWPLDG
ncbi:MAG: tRNA (adenosine(37)-N6)-threonylcarbamoyltransferase complex transferase subunit TsaD [Thermodesulfobacteriota bacterium]|nr:tRNA (adenosine(37)-N6)-threonylcarbamoyltransferase complex transferase subunit TsaD [Thermodesulfobacteriota bacterium]